MHRQKESKGINAFDFLSIISLNVEKLRFGRCFEGGITAPVTLRSRLHLRHQASNTALINQLLKLGEENCTVFRIRKQMN